jgi:hypothetical protein
MPVVGNFPLLSKLTIFRTNRLRKEKIVVEKDKRGGIPCETDARGENRSAKKR